MKISIEIDTGFATGTNEKGKVIAFPSVVARKLGSSISDMLLDSSADYEVEIYSTKDSKPILYYVGESALIIGGVRKEDNKELYESSDFQVLLLTLLSLLNEGDEAIQLCLSLPRGLYSTCHLVLEKVKNNLPVIKIGHIEKQIVIEDIFVYPKSSGTYYSSNYSDSGNVLDKQMLYKPMIISHVGYEKTNFLYLSYAKDGMYPKKIEELSFGYKSIFQGVQISLSSTLKKKVDLWEIEESFLKNDGIYEFGGQDYPLHREKDKQVVVFGNKLKEMIRDWSSDIDSDVLIFGGGWPKEIIPNFSFLSSVKDPRFSEVKGGMIAQAIFQKVEGRAVSG